MANRVGVSLTESDISGVSDYNNGVNEDKRMTIAVPGYKKSRSG
jgi:hypothetical protein